MKTQHYILGISLLALGLNLPTEAAAQTATVYDSQQSLQNEINKSKSAKERIASNRVRRNHTFSDFGQAYTDFKNRLNKDYGFDYSVDISYMGQRAAPNGKKNSMQTYIYPSITWTTFNNEYGTGTLNAAYTIIRYGGKNGSWLGNRIGVQTGINDYTTAQNSFDELYYSYQLGGKWNWLTLGLGQFPLYNFDGSAYAANQQVNFINYALSQNGSSTYSTAGVGLYAQIAPNEDWTFVFGGQDATDIDGTSVQLNNFSDEHYTSFASLFYTPTIKGLGAGQYSVMLYNVPGVKKQPETTNGWSLNISQDLGEKLAIFGRVNGVSGHTATINQSYVLGAVYNNPLDRNPLDQIGLAFAYNKIDEDAVGSKLNHDSEKIIEGYWAWGISKWMTLTPDIQFYIDPASNPKSDYATVFTLRSTFFF